MLQRYIGPPKKRRRRRRRKKNSKSSFFTSRGAYINCALLYIFIILIRFRISCRTRWWCLKCDVPSVRYSSVCNVLRLWRIWLIPTYRVYQLYDTTCLMQIILRRYMYACEKHTPINEALINYNNNSKFSPTNTNLCTQHR